MVKRLWSKALTGIPRITKDEWKELDTISRWLIATRAAVLIITFLSACISGILAHREGLFDFKIWVLVTLGLLLAHATNNLINDWVDWKKGVDQQNYYRNKYGAHPLSVMTESELFQCILVTGTSALLIGAYLCYLRGGLVIVFFLLGSFFLLFYTWPLKYIALGEVSVFLVWGILMIGGGFVTITQKWSWSVVLASCPYSIGVTTVIFGKHIDKLEADRAKGIRTLPVVLGEYLAERTVLLMIISQYAFVLYLVFVDKSFSWKLLISLVAIVSDLRQNIFTVFQKPRPAAEPPGYPPNVWPLYFVAHAFAHNRSFGSLFLLGLILDTFI